MSVVAGCPIQEGKLAGPKQRLTVQDVLCAPKSSRRYVAGFRKCDDHAHLTGAAEGHAHPNPRRGQFARLRGQVIEQSAKGRVDRDLQNGPGRQPRNLVVHRICG